MKGKSLLLLIFVFALFSSNLLAQNKDGEIKMPDSFEDAYIFIVDAEIIGNKKTREKIIIRELDFNVGDSLATFEPKDQHVFSSKKRISRSDSSEVSMRIKYSRENIINSSLFLIVNIELKQIHERNYKLVITVKERWYVWVFPVVNIDAPNFNEWISDPDVGQLNQGIFMSHNNLLGLSHQTSIVVYGGSSQKVGFGYHIPWVGDGQKMGLKMGVIYSSDAVIEYGSVGNERQMLFDKNSVDKWEFLASLNVRPNLYNYSTLKLSAVATSVSDSLFEKAPDYLPDSAKSTLSMNLYVDYAYDSRNSKAYPLKGNYLKGFIDKQGLGILSHDVNYFYYGIDFHFYQKLSDRFYVGEMVKVVTSSSRGVAYSHKQSLTSGDNYLRGFDYNALRGDNLFTFRGNIKYELIKPDIYISKRKPESKFRNIQYAFYVNLFSDAGWVSDRYSTDDINDLTKNYNPLNNKMLYSWGVGVDFVSYYNMVLRFEYAFTSERTNGFFFGFGMPI